MSQNGQHKNSITLTNVEAKYHAVGGPYRTRSNRLKTKHLYVGLSILLIAVFLTAVVVYYLSSYIHRRPAPASQDGAIETGSSKINRVLPDPEVPPPPSPSVLHSFQKGAVCTDGAPCSKIGRDILEKNGSAVDATLAAMFCNGVVNCQSMGLGGGFLMTIYERLNKTSYALVAREVAPIKATKEMFMANTDTSRNGALASGVPGELRGYWAAWKRFGKLPWREIVEPSVRICNDGYQMTLHQFNSLGFRPKELLQADPNLSKWFIHPDTGEILPRGTLIRPTKLCETLAIIAEEGGDSLYNGSLAPIFVEDVQKLGGIITLEDMENQHAKWREPIKVTLHDEQTIHTAPPPGSGALLAFILNILDGYHMNASSVADTNNTVLTIHRIAEAFKYAYARRTELGDPDFVDVKKLIEELGSKEYAEETRKKITDDRTFNDAKHYGAVYYNQEDHGTAHISVLAPNGDAVSVTSTINLYFGAGVTSERTGIALNSGMDDFSVPGVINFFGIPPSPNNFIEPGKMSLSSVSPTIITDKNGDVSMVVGASGGTKITTAVAGIIINAMWLNNTIKQAVDASRIHHQLHPNTIEYEYGLVEPVVRGLKDLGHNMTMVRPASTVCGLTQINGTIYANADYRKGGEVYGINN